MSYVSDVACEKFCVMVRESSFGGDGFVCTCRGGGLEFEPRYWALRRSGVGTRYGLALTGTLFATFRATAKEHAKL